VADQGVVNGGTCDAAKRKPRLREVLLCFQGDQRQPLTNVSQKEERSSPLTRSLPKFGDGGIDFGQAVGTAGGVAEPCRRNRFRLGS